MRVARQVDNIATSYNSIIKWLEDYYRKQELPTYRGLELSKEFQTDVNEARKIGRGFFIDPMLPIDLVMVSSRREQDHETRKLKETYTYTLFWIASSAHKSLERSLQFYQLYLSRVAEPRAVRITMVIPITADKKLEGSLRAIAKSNGFGLWRITFQEKPEELCAPKSFLEHMEDSFANPPKDMKCFSSSIRAKAPEIALFFDRYVLDALDAVAGATPAEIGKRYIEREVLDLVFDLQNVSYAEELKEMVTKHLRDKDDDYQFVENTFSALWSQCAPGMDYSNFLRIGELSLYNIFASKKKPYRDHYLHQFQVFLLGSRIIDELMGGSHLDIGKHPNIDKQWLIASSFHDMAYPLQLYDIWAKEFFEESLGIPDIGISDLKTYFVDKSLLSTLGFIINALCEKHFDGSLKDNWLYKEKELILFLYDRITRLKHHCLLSSLFLLKQAQQLHRPDLLYDLFVPAGLAIALHHYDKVWRKLRNETDEAWEKLPKKRRLQSLEFERDPLAFLLIFCDCVQEWGRPTLKYPKKESLEGEEKWCILREFTTEVSKCLAVIRTPQLSRTAKRFKVKDKELGNLAGFLKTPKDMEFKIVLEDMSYTKSEHLITRTRT